MVYSILTNIFEKCYIYSKTEGSRNCPSQLFFILAPRHFPLFLHMLFTASLCLCSFGALFMLRQTQYTGYKKNLINTKFLLNPSFIYYKFLLFNDCGPGLFIWPFPWLVFCFCLFVFMFSISCYTANLASFDAIHFKSKMLKMSDNWKI